MSKNLIYMCIFYQENYINLLKLLIESIFLYSKINRNTTDILIMTSESFKKKCEEQL
jgi:hypothetical protein